MGSQGVEAVSNVILSGAVLTRQLLNYPAERNRWLVAAALKLLREEAFLILLLLTFKMSPLVAVSASLSNFICTALFAQASTIQHAKCK